MIYVTLRTAVIRVYNHLLIILQENYALMLVVRAMIRKLPPPGPNTLQQSSEEDAKLMTGKYTLQSTHE